MIDQQNYFNAFPRYALKFKLPVKSYNYGLRSQFSTTLNNNPEKVYLHKVQTAPTRSLYLIETTDPSLLILSGSGPNNSLLYADGSTYDSLALINSFVTTQSFRDNSILYKVTSGQVNSFNISFSIQNQSTYYYTGAYGGFSFGVNSGSTCQLTFQAPDQNNPSLWSTYYTNGLPVSNNMGLRFGVNIFYFFVWIDPNQWWGEVTSNSFVFERPFIPIKAITTLTNNITNLSGVHHLDSGNLGLSIPIYDYNLEDLECKPQSFTSGSYTGIYILEKLD
jgi:hypothetical protein